MARSNPHFGKLPKNYIFSLMGEKQAQMRANRPNEEILNLGVGDISLPLAPSIALAIGDAALEMSRMVRGYGPEVGYLFLREALIGAEYGQLGFSPEEIFLSDGTNTDAATLHELFDEKTKILIPSPTYPVYFDSSVVVGKEVHLLPTRQEEGFIPRPPKEGYDLVFLCNPSNPTGIAMGFTHLEEWVTWAKKHKAILIVDNVYSCFISSPNVPRSIYEISGAREVAIEMRSFSKQAGFTGLRCAYMVVPKSLHLPELHSLCHRWKSFKTNGVSYPIQKGALASLSGEGKRETSLQIETYKRSAAILRSSLDEQGETYYGGTDSPYIWWKVPAGVSSQQWSDTLLNESLIVTIPGSGFGPSGEGFVRLSCFISNRIAEIASERIETACAL